MKERLINGKQAIMAHDESAEVAEPSEGALHGPPSFIPTQRSTILGRGFAPVLAMRGDQLDAARRKHFAGGLGLPVKKSPPARDIAPTHGRLYFGRRVRPWQNSPQRQVTKLRPA